MEIIGHDTNCETGEVTPIYLTPEITARFKVIESENAIAAAQEETNTLAKDALLTKLGITADEAKLLLG